VSEGNLDGDTFAVAPEQASSLRMVTTLGAAGALAGLLIVAVFTMTLRPIEAYKAEVLRRAVSEVLNDPVRYETLYATAQGVFDVPPGARAEKIYVGMNGNGLTTGVAIKAGAAGFQDTITLIYGFDPATGELLGMKVLESRETPGLGDKIEKDEVFVAQFKGAAPPLVAVRRVTGALGEIDAISGATISSRAVVRIINQSLAQLRSPIEAHFMEASP
jgi:electron transport complex protein RnfG